MESLGMVRGFSLIINMDREEEKIVSFPHRPRIKKLNIITAFLFLVFLYMLVVVYLYFHSDPIVRYEVAEGSLSENTNYRALALREETGVGCNADGYVNYLAREGQRVAVGDTVYTVDETGLLKQYLESASLSGNTLTDRELTDFRNDITNFSGSFDPRHFSQTYDFKYTVKNAVLKLANTNLLNQLELSSPDGSSAFRFGYSALSGIVSYWQDGLEDLTPEQVTGALFTSDTYEKKQLLSNELHNQGETVYKVATSENWSLMIPVEEEVGERLLKEDYVKVRFLKNLYESWAKVSLVRNGEELFAQLSLHDSMNTFVTDRFLDVQLILDEQTGLKIPNSAITNKEFFLLDENFVYHNDETNAYYVNRQSFSEAGTLTSSPVTIEIYSYSKENRQYYVDDSILSHNDILYAEDGQTTFVVNRVGSLPGVYNVNKGYADFKQIKVLYSNDEYSIVESLTDYGLRVYDFIALDADSVQSDEFIND